MKSTMQNSIEKHTSKITGKIAGFDRILFWIEDHDRAQRFKDNFVKKNCPAFQAMAKRFNPFLGGLLKSMNYCWVIDQAEFATDVMFTDRGFLKPLYKELLKHSTLTFSAEDALNFLGNKLHGFFKGEVLKDYKRAGLAPVLNTK